MKKLLILIIILTLTGCTVKEKQADFVLDQAVERPKPEALQEEVKDKSEPASAEAGVEGKPETIEVELEIPATFDQEIDFASQAPYGDWGLPYQEACEEASLVTASKFFNQQKLDQQIMDEEIKKLVEWEKENLGLYTDTSAEEVVKIAKEYFNLDAELTEDVTVDRIKAELVKGNLIIAPFAGRELGNKYFTQPGPIYHMLVIRGYDRNEFITNDVGTRRGKGFKYEYDVVINAIHDLPLNADRSIFRPYDDTNSSDEFKAGKMKTGPKVMIILSKGGD